MPNESDEPLRKCTLNLYRADVEYLEKMYGRGWTETVRNIVRQHRDRLKVAEHEINLSNQIRRLTGV